MQRCAETALAAGLVCFRDGALLGAVPQEAFLSGLELREEAVTAWLHKMGALANTSSARDDFAGSGSDAINSESVRTLANAVRWVNSCCYAARMLHTVTSTFPSSISTSAIDVDPHVVIVNMVFNASAYTCK